jgi:hypothetical protein
MPSKSSKQHRFMEAIAHSPSFAKKVGVKQSVGKDFAAADKGKTFARGGSFLAKINKQDTRHGKMDMPFTNLSRYAGMKEGGNVKNLKSLFKGKESYGEEMKEAKAIKSGKITPKQYAMGEKSEIGMKKGGMAKYAKGGSIRRMADGGMTAPMAPPMAPQAPVDPRQMAAMQAAMQAQGGAPMAPPAPGMKRGGSVRFAKGGGIESRGKTKGTIIRMASGGSVSSASRRADGIAQRGKTKC